MSNSGAKPMVSDQQVRQSRGTRFAVGFAIVAAAVFTVGVLIGYNSIYRDISVAMLSPPTAVSPL
jgi:hypothetical protein